MNHDEPKLLIVDDEANFRQYLRARLQRAFPAASILLTQDPEEALQVLRTQSIDLVLSDHHMAGVDGLAMLTQARLIRPATIRVLLTGGADLPRMVVALADGTLHAAFQKPLEGDKLVEGVDRLLASAKARHPRVDAVPLQEKPQEKTVAPLQPRSTEGPLRALFVDDVLAVAEVWATLASRIDPDGIEVIVESDPRKALEWISHERFDVIVTDYRMPHVSGIDLLIKAKETQPHARRILVTGYNEVPELAPRLQAANVDAYIHKPTPAQDALLLLRDALSNDAHAMDTHREQARIIERRAQRNDTQLELDDA